MSSKYEPQHVKLSVDAHPYTGLGNPAKAFAAISDSRTERLSLEEKKRHNLVTEAQKDADHDASLAKTAASLFGDSAIFDTSLADDKDASAKRKKKPSREFDHGITGLIGNLSKDLYDSAEGLTKLAANVTGDYLEVFDDAIGSVTGTDFIHRKHNLFQDMGLAVKNRDKIGYALEQSAKQWGDMYAPLVHGDFSKFAHNVYEHPLQPIMDALTLATLGTGAVVSTSAKAASIAGDINKLARVTGGVVRDVGDGNAMRAADALNDTRRAFSPKTARTAKGNDSQIVVPRDRIIHSRAQAKLGDAEIGANSSGVKIGVHSANPVTRIQEMAFDKLLQAAGMNDFRQATAIAKANRIALQRNAGMAGITQGAKQLRDMSKKYGEQSVLDAVGLVFDHQNADIEGGSLAGIGASKNPEVAAQDAVSVAQAAQKNDQDMLAILTNETPHVEAVEAIAQGIPSEATNTHDAASRFAANSNHETITTAAKKIINEKYAEALAKMPKSIRDEINGIIKENPNANISDVVNRVVGQRGDGAKKSLDEALKNKGGLSDAKKSQQRLDEIAGAATTKAGKPRKNPYKAVVKEIQNKKYFKARRKEILSEIGDGAADDAHVDALTLKSLIDEASAAIERRPFAGQSVEDAAKASRNEVRSAKLAKEKHEQAAVALAEIKKSPVAELLEEYIDKGKSGINELLQVALLKERAARALEYAKEHGLDEAPSDLDVAVTSLKNRMDKRAEVIKSIEDNGAESPIIKAFIAMHHGEDGKDGFAARLTRANEAMLAEHGVGVGQKHSGFKEERVNRNAVHFAEIQSPALSKHVSLGVDGERSAIPASMHENSGFNYRFAFNSAEPQNLFATFHALNKYQQVRNTLRSAWKSAVVVDDSVKHKALNGFVKISERDVDELSANLLKAVQDSLDRNPMLTLPNNDGAEGFVGNIKMAQEMLDDLKKAGHSKSVYMPKRMWAGVKRELQPSKRIPIYDDTTGLWRLSVVSPLRPAFVTNNVVSQAGLLSIALSSFRSMKGMIQYASSPEARAAMREYMGGVEGTGQIASLSRQNEDLLNIQKILDMERTEGYSGKHIKAYKVKAKAARFIHDLNAVGQMIGDDPFRRWLFGAKISPSATKELDRMHRDGIRFPILDDEGVAMADEAGEAITRPAVMEDAMRSVMSDPHVVDNLERTVLGDLVDFDDISYNERNIIRRFMPFYSWIKGSSKLTIDLMKRNPAVADAATFAGMKYEEHKFSQHGDVPTWMRGLYGLERHKNNIDPRAVELDQFNPFLSLPEMTQSAAKIISSPASGQYLDNSLSTSISPILQAAIASLTHRDSFTHESLPADQSAPRVFFNELKGAFPQVRAMEQIHGNEMYELPDGSKMRQGIYKKSAGIAVANYFGIPVKYQIDLGKAYGYVDRPILEVTSSVRPRNDSPDQLGGYVNINGKSYYNNLSPVEARK